MKQEIAMRKVISRAAANLVAVAAISAIFGLKAYIDHQATRVIGAGGEEAVLASTSGYDPYLTEQP